MSPLMLLGKLIDIVNISFNLGEKISDSKDMRKKFRFLLERF